MMKDEGIISHWVKLNFPHYPNGFISRYNLWCGAWLQGRGNIFAMEFRSDIFIITEMFRFYILHSRFYPPSIITISQIQKKIKMEIKNAMSWYDLIPNRYKQWHTYIMIIWASFNAYEIMYKFQMPLTELQNP